MPLDEPKIGMLDAEFKKVPSKLYETEILNIKNHFGVVGPDHMEQLQQRKGARFLIGRVGYAAQSQFRGECQFGRTYDTTWDYNENGVIDEEDEQILARHIGRKVRYNLYRHAYYGGDWLTTYVNLGTEHQPGTRVIADYVYGGGYDSLSGIVYLLDTPGPDKPVWIEYHYDAPPEAGTDNIVLHLYREA